MGGSHLNLQQSACLATNHAAASRLVLIVVVFNSFSDTVLLCKSHVPELEPAAGGHPQVSHLQNCGVQAFTLGNNAVCSCSTGSDW